MCFHSLDFMASFIMAGNLNWANAISKVFLLGFYGNKFMYNLHVQS